MSIKDVECLEEGVILSLESNGGFEFEDSFLAMKICYPLGTLLFACQIDGCSPEVCSHILSVSPSFAPSLPNDFLYNTEMGYLMGDITKHLKSLTKDNFQLVLVKTGGTQFANIKSKVLSICLPRISCIRVWLVLETGSTQLANVESKISSIHQPRIFCITQFLNLLNSSSEDASPFPYDRGKTVPYMLPPIKAPLAYVATSLPHLSGLHQHCIKICIPCLYLHREPCKYVALVVTPLAFLPMGSDSQVYEECFHPVQVLFLMQRALAFYHCLPVVHSRVPHSSFTTIKSS